jgi:hypothetical protein
MRSFPIDSGFVADTVLYLSYYFDTNALSVRLSWFWVSMTMTSILGSFLAAGLLALRGKGGLEGWRWLFMVEGIMTFLIGVWAFFYLPAGPTQTAGGIRGKGWFTEYVGCVLFLRLAFAEVQRLSDERKSFWSTTSSVMILPRVTVSTGVVLLAD